jgi:hypothetical protein
MRFHKGAGSNGSHVHTTWLKLCGFYDSPLLAFTTMHRGSEVSSVCSLALCSLALCPYRCIIGDCPLPTIISLIFSFMFFAEFVRAGAVCWNCNS